MATQKLSNISLKLIRKLLLQEQFELQHINKGRGGHEKWTKSGLDRPIIIQSHKDPVPEFIIKQIIRHLEIERNLFFEKLDNLK